MTDIVVKTGLAEARRLGEAHWRALLAYIALGVVLPYLLLSSEPVFHPRFLMALFYDPLAFGFSGSLAGPLYLLGIVALFVCGAMLAAWHALLAEMREGYVAEIMYGMVAGAAYLIVSLIFFLVVATIFSLPIYALGGREALSPAAEVLRQLVGGLVSAWISARFCLVGPIMASRGALEPVTAFVESWRRTGSAQGRLTALYLSINILFVLVLVALFIPQFVVAATIEPGGAADAAMGLAWLFFAAVYFAAMLLIPAGLYRVSEPGAQSEVFA